MAFQPAATTQNFANAVFDLDINAVIICWPLYNNTLWDLVQMIHSILWYSKCFGMSCAMVLPSNGLQINHLNGYKEQESLQSLVEDEVMQKLSKQEYCNCLQEISVQNASNSSCNRRITSSQACLWYFLIVWEANATYVSGTLNQAHCFNGSSYLVTRSISYACLQMQPY